MRRMALIAAFAALLFLPAWAQRGGGGHVGGARSGGAMHGSARVSARVGGVSHSFTHHGFGRSGAFRHERDHDFDDRHHHHHNFFRSRFGYPWGYAYYGDYWDYPLDYSDYDESYNQNQELQGYQLRQMNNQQQIEQRLDELEERLDRLSDTRSAPAPQAQAQPKTQSNADTSQPAVLVYKDGHKQEVQNYAIVGQTIWVLNEQQAKKVPLSALDLNATRKANEDRDVEFAVPGSST